MDNIFKEIPDIPFLEELTAILYQNAAVRIQRILSCGQASAPDFWYDQDEDEWLVLLTGHAVLEIEIQKNSFIKKELEPGSILFLPKHQRHRVDATSKEPPCNWLCVFIKSEKGYLDGKTKTGSN